MYAEVDERTAAGLLLCGKPTALSGNAASSDPTATTAIDVTHVAVGNIIFQEFRRVAMTVVSHRHKHLTGGVRRFLHSRYFLDGYRVGFFRKNVQPLIQRVNGNDGMQIVRRADIHIIKTFHLKQIVIISECGEILGEMIAFLERLDLGRQNITDRRKLHVVHSSVSAHVRTLGDTAETDQTNLIFLLHFQDHAFLFRFIYWIREFLFVFYISHYSTSYHFMQ